MSRDSFCKCGGTGVIELDGKMGECVCAYSRRRFIEMPPFLKSAHVEFEHVSHPVVRSVKKSLQVDANWDDMKAIIKTVWLKYPSLFVRVTTDNEILNVYLGNQSRKAKGPDEAGPVYNSVQDLVDSPDLVIIQLNKMGHKNKAAAGVLGEAIQYRMDMDKPIWVMRDPGSHWTLSSFSWSEATEELVTALPLMVVRISKPERPVTVMAPAPVLAAMQQAPVRSSPPVQVRIDEPVRERPQKTIRSVPDDEPLTGIHVYGSGLPNKKKKPFGNGGH